jgi:hypothetical protein
VQNKHTNSNDWQVFNDPLGDTWQGKHFYMNRYTYNEAIGHLQNAMDAGVDPNRMVNTEVGASFNEHPDYTTENVGQLNDYLAWCYERGIGNMVWLNKNTYNLGTYEDLGLDLPWE